MPFCVKCGNEIKKSDKFCPECGTPNRLSKSDDKIKGTGTKLGDEGDYGAGQADASGNTVKSANGNYGLNLDSLEPGIVLENRYEIVKKLGSGGFGVVYQAADKYLSGRLKAIKVIFTEHYGDKIAMHKLQKEAEVMLEFTHPNIVRLFDLHLSGEIRFLDMEYVEGGDLTDLMISYPDMKIPEDKAIEIARQISKGMQSIHKKRIIHKDLKPQNIMLSSNGTVKIMDFGIAETFRSSQSRLKETSRTGTYAYMSPEHLNGKKVGKESDIWSFGIILAELLTGEQLYYGDSYDNMLTMIKHNPFEPIAGVSDRTNKLITKCLQTDYKKRYHDFSEILEILNNHSDDDSSEILNSGHIRSDVDSGFFEMVKVDGGIFLMGSDNLGTHNDERPIHTVTLSDFYIGKYPVTQELYQKVMNKNPSEEKGIGGNYPVYNVSWYEAVEFCNKLSEMESLDKCYSSSGEDLKCNFDANGYRLPTEAEWEYAARGGNKSEGYKYSGSNDIDEVAEYIGNNNESTKPVGGKKANELGIYDMSGNVCEWCWDLKDRYRNISQTNPKGPAWGSGRVFRGGSWYYNASSCRVANRYFSSPDYGYNFLGFRLVRSSK